ncbi:hypothetical protein F3Y22_tig00112428pilonHSYRG00045 [Hibiscus syriacus]|uniref:C2H2-type domain-containing protein n=1 Tax=Hibiscus syriacus TaxID=106335 RepID=A0A6A2XJH2_HIBSY|nr:hypothetical protein F3Y22_tig00112428pilonHSYRG00045 [Hibiscus syriacus]
MLEDDNNRASISLAALPSSSSDKPLENGAAHKRKRKQAGTPDPDSEVVSLSPETLLESDGYVCEICKQGFQRDQNLQMHRRRHKVPWKFLKRGSSFVPSRRACTMNPVMLLEIWSGSRNITGGNTAIRNKGFARNVRKDTRFSRITRLISRPVAPEAILVTVAVVEGFIEHQDVCTVRRVQPELQAACLSRSASSNGLPSDAVNFGIPRRTEPVFLQRQQQHCLELQLLSTRDSDENHATRLKLSIGSNASSETTLGTTRLKELAMADKA